MVFVQAPALPSYGNRVSGIWVSLQESLWQTRTDMTEQRGLIEDSCSKKDHRFLCRKRHKIIVGSATDMTNRLQYSNSDGFSCADIHPERCTTPVFVCQRDKGREQQSMIKEAIHARF